MSRSNKYARRQRKNHPHRWRIIPYGVTKNTGAIFSRCPCCSVGRDYVDSFRGAERSRARADLADVARPFREMTGLEYSHSGRKEVDFPDWQEDFHLDMDIEFYAEDLFLLEHADNEAAGFRPTIADLVAA